MESPPGAKRAVRTLPRRKVTWLKTGVAFDALREPARYAARAITRAAPAARMALRLRPLLPALRAAIAEPLVCEMPSRRFTRSRARSRVEPYRSSGSFARHRSTI